MISLQQRRDHVSRPHTQLRFARSRTRTKPNDFPVRGLRSTSISPSPSPSPSPPPQSPILRKPKTHKKQHLVCGASCLHSSKPGRVFSDRSQGVHESVSGPSMDTHDINTPHCSESNGTADADRAVPEPHIAFCHIFLHPLFPLFELHISKWVFLSVVVL